MGLHLCELLGTIKEAQLVAFMQPSLNPLDGNWNEVILKESACDSNVALTNFQLGVFDSYDVIYTTGVYLRRLSLFYTTARDAIYTTCVFTCGIYLYSTLQLAMRPGTIQMMYVSYLGSHDCRVAVAFSAGYYF